LLYLARTGHLVCFWLLFSLALENGFGVGVKESRHKRLSGAQ